MIQLPKFDLDRMLPVVAQADQATLETMKANIGRYAEQGSADAATILQAVLARLAEIERQSGELAWQIAEAKRQVVLAACKPRTGAGNVLHPIGEHFAQYTDL